MFRHMCKEYDDEELCQDPDVFRQKPAKLTGEVIEIAPDGDGSRMRMCVTKTAYGFYTDVVYVSIPAGVEGTDSIRLGSIIRVYGNLYGTQTYMSAQGQITVPKLVARCWTSDERNGGGTWCKDFIAVWIHHPSRILGY